MPSTPARLILLRVLTATYFLFLANAHIFAQGNNPPSDMDALTSEAQQLTKHYMKTLKRTLQGSILASGPSAAIQVCSVNAPAIALSIGEQADWRVARTSEKLRNPNNKPDLWERRVLQNFAIKINKGAPINNLEETAIVNLNGKKAFRYMKAISVGNVCLTCHGSSISGSVASTINDRYPKDQAKGYRKGDLRGAFTLYKYINQATQTTPTGS